LVSNYEKNFYSLEFQKLDDDQNYILVNQQNDQLRFPQKNEAFPQSFAISIHRLAFLVLACEKALSVIQEVLQFGNQELTEMKKKSKELKNDLPFLYNNSKLIA
jgi:hypothetical protein